MKLKLKSAKRRWRHFPVFLLQKSMVIDDLHPPLLLHSLRSLHGLIAEVVMQGCDCHPDRHHHRFCRFREC
jgi:hypothetical protein